MVLYPAEMPPLLPKLQLPRLPQTPASQTPPTKSPAISHPILDYNPRENAVLGEMGGNLAQDIALKCQHVHIVQRVSFIQLSKNEPNNYTFICTRAGKD